jgi:DMATS type aromatic prenyltransferase
MSKSNGHSISPFVEARQELQSRHEDHAFWWSMLGESFATFLKSSQYSEEHQLYYLRWFQKWILGSFGPRPVDGKAYHRPEFAWDGSPLEFSINWKEKKPTRTVRFTAEPMTRNSGRPADLLNQRAAHELFTAMSRDVPGIDLTRFNLLLSETSVPDHFAEKVLAELPAGHPKSRVLVAYDLEGGAVVAKAYYNPEHKSILKGIPSYQVVFDAIRKCTGPYGTYDASIAAVEEFLTSHVGPVVTLLANDCVVDSPSSRLKVYVTSPVTNLTTALENFNLAGRITGPRSEAGLKAVRAFWCHAFGLDSESPDVETKEVLPAGSRCVFVHEMRPRTDDQPGVDIEVKMHVPGSWLGDTDTKIIESLSAWFEKNGHPEFASSYGSEVAAAL